MPERTPTLEGPDAYLTALRDASSSLIELYRDDPEGLALRLGLKLPDKPVVIMQRLGVYDPDKHGPITPGLRDMVLEVCSGEVEDAVAVGPRGGGKSQGVSFIEFFLWALKNYDALNLGGSELQADAVYQYFLRYIESEREFQQIIKGDTLQSKTTSKKGNWIRVLTASQKSVRSPHAGGRIIDGRPNGGLLVIDEEAEADPAIVNAALPTINTAQPSVNVRCSTFHNDKGTFAEVVEDHESMGYKLYRWDIFDVSTRCDCTGGTCQSPEPCFREDHFEEYTDPDDGELKRRLLHKAYCGGRSQYADGWVKPQEIIKLWRRMKRNHMQWEVEAMGSRPTTVGKVIRDQIKYSQNITTLPLEDLYVPGLPVTICADWGSVAAGICVWQEQTGDEHVLLHADLVEEAGLTQILGVVLGYWNRYPEAVEVAADIGGGGNYLNPVLREEHRIPVRDVNFAEEKEAAVAAWNIYNEAGKAVYPADYEDFHRQARRWSRKSGRIQKGDDHLMDSSVCYFSKFIERLGLSNVRIAPRSFGTGGSREPATVSTPGSSFDRPNTTQRRVVAVRGFGGRPR